MRNKEKTSFALTAECRRLLELLSEKMGISKSNVLEIIVREKAQKETTK